MHLRKKPAKVLRCIAELPGYVCEGNVHSGAFFVEVWSMMSPDRTRLGFCNAESYSPCCRQVILGSQEKFRFDVGALRQAFVSIVYGLLMFQAGNMDASVSLSSAGACFNLCASALALG